MAKQWISLLAIAALSVACGPVDSESHQASTSGEHAADAGAEPPPGDDGALGGLFDNDAAPVPDGPGDTPPEDPPSLTDSTYGQKPWERDGITASFIDVRNTYQHVISKDRYWLQDLGDPAYTEWSWPKKGRLSDLLPSTGADPAPWAGIGVTAAFSSSSASDKWIVFIRKNKYWALNTPSADPSTWKNGANWFIKAAPLSSAWSDIPGPVHPWDEGGVTAAWVDSNAHLYVVSKRTSGQLIYFHHDGSTWVESGVDIATLLPNPPKLDGTPLYGPGSSGITGVFPWSGSWGIASRDKLWSYKPSTKTWVSSGGLPGYARDLWAKAPYLCDSFSGAAGRSCFDERFTSLLAKMETVLTKQAFDDIETLQGTQIFVPVNGGFTTADKVSQVNAAMAGQPEERVAEIRARLSCGDPPGMGNPPVWPPAAIVSNDWTYFRHCMQVSHLNFATHYTRRYVASGSPADKAKLQAHFYLLTVHLDALTTAFSPDGAPHLALSVWPTGVNREFPVAEMNRLGENGFAQRYIADASGLFMGLSWALAQGHLPTQYCSLLEAPPGFGCVTVDLFGRIRKLMSAVAARTAGAWMYKTGAQTAADLRTKYYDADAWWSYVEAPANTPSGEPSMYGYKVAPNKNDALAITDLAGRKHRVSVLVDQSLPPHTWHWFAAGMAITSKMAGSAGGPWDQIYAFGRDGTAFVLGMDHAYEPSTSLCRQLPAGTPGCYTVPGVTGGVRLRGVSRRCSSGVTPNYAATDPMKVCEGGARELYQYSLLQENDPGVTGMSYSMQHWGGIMATLGWGAPPAVFTNLAQSDHYAFMGTLFKDGHSFIDRNGGFSDYGIGHYYGPLAACGAAGSGYRKGPQGRIVSAGGETAAELFATAAPALAHVISYGNGTMEKAHEVLDALDWGVHDLTKTALSVDDGLCGAPPIQGFPASRLQRKMWQFANLWLSRMLLKKVPINAVP